MRTYRTTLFLILCIGLLLTSCKKKKEDPTIIIHKTEVKKPQGTHKVGDQTRNYDFQWLGANYKAVVERKADPSLPTATDDEGAKYYDNRISVKILRADGSVFYDHTFSKEDFSAELDERIKKNGVLYSMIYVKNDGDNVEMKASVGSPNQMSSDDYVSFTVKISRMGAMKLSKDQQLDTNSEGTDEDMGD
ncbi:MAG: DUF4738 domain-containing protein [Prevotella sp.]|jgi:hypothetical protein